MALKPFSVPSKTEVTGAPRHKILYVEDEDPNWEIAAKRLGGKYNMQRARNAAEVFAKLRSDKFDLVLMDIQLTNSALDGIEITRIIRGKARDPAAQGDLTPHTDLTIPIIFVTAYTARYSREDLLFHGGNDLITKPVDFVQLTLAVTRLILQRMK